jgi:hypothetical protein
MYRLILVNLLILLSACLTRINSLQYEFSVLVEPGKRECFHQFLRGNLNMETDYQVISGGDLDISYWVFSYFSLKLNLYC